MEKLSKPSLAFVIKTYIALTKPGIIMGNLFTAAGGFALASRGHFNVWPFLATLEGLALIIASACIFNNYIDRTLDGKMERTKNRPLVRGVVSPRNAIITATVLGIIGTLTLVLFTNILTGGLALFGLFVYVVLYTFLKPHTMHVILIGSIAGAIPPVVGYSAATCTLDGAALILFFMIALWQMPHFFGDLHLPDGGLCRSIDPHLSDQKRDPQDKGAYVALRHCFYCRFPLALCLRVYRIRLSHCGRPFGLHLAGAMYTGI